MRLMILSDASSAHTIRWVRSLAGRGHEIRLFTLTPPPDVYRDLARVSVVWAGTGLAVAGVGEGTLGKLRYLRGLPELRSQIKSWRPDLVHAHYASSYGLLATLARARPRIVSVWGMDVYSFPRRSRLHRHLVKSVLRSADAVLSTSNVMRREVLGLVDRQVYVTPFGVDTTRFRPNPRPSDELLYVGSVKTLEEKYGIEYLLRAFATIREQGVHRGRYRLVIVGGGSLKAGLERLAGELGIFDDVRFVGPRPYAEVHEWHQSLDLAVYPSIDPSESFGVAVVESQSCGVPVVVSEVGGLPEVVVDRRTGLVVPPKNVEMLAAAILAILDDRELRRTMGESARRHVMETYSLETCLDIMEAVYRRVAAGSDEKPAATSGDGVRR